MISKIVVYQRLKSALVMCLGVFSAAVGLNGFLLPNQFIDGGAMGIALLTNIVSGWNVSFLILVINVPFIIMGYRVISWQFAVKSLISILLLAIAVHFIHIPPLTDDRFLTAIFGGLFIGIGTGLSMRGGSVIDGSEILAIFISRKTTLSVGTFVAFFNVLLFLIAGLIVNLETAMYSMLAYFSASRAIDFIINGIEEYIGVTIISKDYDAIRHALTDELGHAVTVYRAAGGYQSAKDPNRKILFCVVTRLELTQVLNTIETIDSKAFIVQHVLRDSHNGRLKKRPLSS